MIIENTTDLGKDALLFLQKYKAFMGISVEHKFFSKKNMAQYFEWGSKQFAKFVIILMDDPKHYNFMVFKNMDEKTALALARKESNELKLGYEKVIKNLNIPNIKIVQFKDFFREKKYKKILEKIIKFSKVDIEFKKDLLNLMETGIGGKIKELSTKLSEKDVKKAKDTLFQYIIEELAAIIYFTENGYQIEVDPTIEFTTKKMLYDGNFPKISEELELSKRGHIFARLEGITKSSY